MNSLVKVIRGAINTLGMQSIGKSRPLQVIESLRFWWLFKSESESQIELSIELPLLVPSVHRTNAPQSRLTDFAENMYEPTANV